MNSSKQPRRAKIAQTQQFVPGPDGLTQFRALQLELCQSLQVSLVPQTILTQFKVALAKPFGLVAAEMSPMPEQRSAMTAAPSGLILTHQLLAQSVPVGMVKLILDQPLSAPMRAQLLTLADLLALPLRNALQFQALQQQSNTDQLTGLWNRQNMHQALVAARENVRRHQQSAHIAMIDIDHFKKINDEYGHLGGDIVLQEFAQILQNNCRVMDQAYRYGGEEFLMLLPNTDMKGALDMSERLRHSIAAHRFTQLAVDRHLTTSIGIASIDRMQPLAFSIAQADKALYQAKHLGRNQVQIATL